MIRSISWLGVRTDRFEATARFYQDVMGIEPSVSTPDFVLFDLPNGDRIELFGPDGENQHFTDAPVVGFEVDDLDGARSRLEARGVDFVHVGRDEGAGFGWAHFRGPDGNLYEVTGPVSTPDP